MRNDIKNDLPLLQLKDLSIGIHEKGQVYTAVDSISYNVYPGEILGVVGESGCGKTVTNLSIMGLLPDVQKGTTVLPVNFCRSAKVYIIFGASPHQIG